MNAVSQLLSLLWRWGRFQPGVASFSAATQLGDSGRSFDHLLLDYERTMLLPTKKGLKAFKRERRHILLDNKGFMFFFPPRLTTCTNTCVLDKDIPLCQHLVESILLAEDRRSSVRIKAMESWEGWTREHKVEDSDPKKDTNAPSSALVSAGTMTGSALLVGGGCANLNKDMSV